MPTIVQGRLPLAPLLAAAEGKPIPRHGGAGDRYNAAIRRARQAGDTLPISAADQLATQVLGIHPSEVWGEDWWDET